MTIEPSSNKSVQVRLQVFGGTGKAQLMADSLGLTQKQPSHFAYFLQKETAVFAKWCT